MSVDMQRAVADMKEIAGITGADHCRNDVTDIVMKFLADAGHAEPVRTYNSELLSTAQQVAAEKVIADIIFDSGESILDDYSGVDKEVCAGLGRNILLAVLSRFRPDLINDIRTEKRVGTDAVVEPEATEAWPATYRGAAQSQGWDIFDADGSEDGRWQLQAIMNPQDTNDLDYLEPKFSDDRAAAGFVQQQADAGNVVAVAAIQFLICTGSRDVAKFKLRLPEPATEADTETAMAAARKRAAVACYSPLIRKIRGGDFKTDMQLRTAVLTKLPGKRNAVSFDRIAKQCIDIRSRQKRHEQILYDFVKSCQ